MAEGLTSRDKKRNLAQRKKDLLNHNKKCQLASKIVGANSLDMLKLPDNRMDTLPFLDIVKEIEKKILKYKPDLILTHHANDLNIDHQLTHKAVITASRPQPNSTVKKILTFEVLSSTGWTDPSKSNTFNPNYFVDITKYIKKKIEALNVYKTEMRPFPHARSIKAVKSLSKYRGSSVGIEEAEAFMLVREIS